MQNHSYISSTNEVLYTACNTDPFTQSSHLPNVYRAGIMSLLCSKAMRMQRD